MAKVFGAVFVIFGAVVGSGFSSGKEIYVFFSRFGAVSYFFVALACILFFFLLKFIMKNGEKLSVKIQKTSWLSLVTAAVSIVFCASMMSALSSLSSQFSTIFQAIFMAIVLLLCLVVARRGMGSLQKINSALMPLVGVMFFVVLLFFALGSDSFSANSNFFGVFYAPLYVALNTSMNVLVLCELGKKMTKKEINRTCVFSVGLIFLFLMLGNFVLGSVSGESEMPFLQIASSNTAAYLVMFFVIFSGCFTTLISLSFTLKCALSTFIKSENLCVLLAVFLPFCLSFFGFSQIVSLLYPICSALGLLVLFFLIFRS